LDAHACRNSQFAPGSRSMVARNSSEYVPARVMSSLGQSMTPSVRRLFLESSTKVEVRGRRVSRYRVAALVSVACALLCASVVHAQRAPDAGSILRDFGGGAPQQAQVLPPSEAPPPAPPADTGGARVLVKDFRIRATQFPEPTLRRLLD